MSRFHQAKTHYALAHKYFLSPLTYLLISGDYLEDEDFDKEEAVDLLLLAEWGVQPKSTALTLLWILVKIWFFTVFRCFKILLGFERVFVQDEGFSEDTGVIRDKHFTSGNWFSQEEMIDCSFEGASLVGANFSYSFLTRCDFRNADLRRAKFDMTELRECDFTGANLEGAVFEGAEGREVKGLNVHLEEI